MPTENQSNTVIALRPGKEFWDKLNTLPRYMFLLKPSGNGVQKLEDFTGNWIDVHEAQQVVDQAQEENNQLRAERDALQLRLNAADQRIDELTAQHQPEQVALMPVERSYDVRAKQLLAFNTCKQGGGDLDDALGAAYKAALLYTPHPDEQPAPVSVVRPIDPERERLIEIIERYPNSDPLEYDAAARELQQ
jgi:regulator of replication initiation timing